MTGLKKRVSKAAGAVSVASLATLGLVTTSTMMAPHAAAETCETTHIAVQSGSVSWGIKKSFTSYIKNPVITKGGWDLNGGVTENNHIFTFPAAKDGSPIDNAHEGTIVFNGSLRIFGHEKDGVEMLDMTMKNLKLKVTGSTGQLIATFRTRQYVNDYTAGPMTAWVTKPLVDVTFDQAPDFTQSAIDVTATTKVAEGAYEMLGGKNYPDKYGVGKPLENLHLVLTTNPKQCGAKPTDTSGGGSGSDGSLTGKAQGSVIDFADDVNDRIVKFNTLTGNAMTMMDNVDKLRDRFNRDRGQSTPSSQGGAATGGSGSNSTSGGASPSGTTGGGASASTAAGGSGATTPGASAPAAGTAAPAAQVGACTSGAKAVSRSSLKWGVKKSFVSYITGSIANGKFDTTNVGYEGGEFVFAGSRGSFNPATKSGTIPLGGKVHFTGHEGLLDMVIANPVVTINRSTGALIADISSNDMNGKAHNYGRVEMASLSFSSLNATGTSVSGTATTSLTKTGAEAFANFYQPGSQLAPITISAQLSGQCAGATGVTTGASVGTGDAGAVSSAAAGGAAASGAGQLPPSVEVGSSSDESGSGDAGSDGNQPSKFKILSQPGEDGLHPATTTPGVTGAAGTSAHNNQTLAGASRNGGNAWTNTLLGIIIGLLIGCMFFAWRIWKNGSQAAPSARKSDS